MKTKIAKDTPAAKIRRRIGMGLAIPGSLIVGDSVALSGWQGCSRLANVYLADHNLALGLFLLGALLTAAGVYLQVKHRVRYVAERSGVELPMQASAA